MEPFEYINRVYHEANIELFEAQINIQHIQYSILENYNEDSKVLYEGTLKDTGKKIIDIIKKFFNNIIRAMERWIAKILSCFSKGLTDKIDKAISDYGFKVPELSLEEVNKRYSQVVEHFKNAYISSRNFINSKDYDDKDKRAENFTDNAVELVNCTKLISYLKGKFNSSKDMDLEDERAELNMYKGAIKNLYTTQNTAISIMKAKTEKYGADRMDLAIYRKFYFTHTKDFVNIIQRRAQIAAMSIIKAAKIGMKGAKANTIDIEKYKKIYDDANKSFVDASKDTLQGFGFSDDSINDEWVN